jgi:hypothetical protein
MSSSGAKVYISPEMLKAWDKITANDENYTPQEAEYLDDTTEDKLLTYQYRVYHLDHNMTTRPGGPRATMPYLTRGGFCQLFVFLVLQIPVCYAFWHVTKSEDTSTDLSRIPRT